MSFYRGIDVVVDIHTENSAGLTVDSDGQVTVATPGTTVPNLSGTQNKIIDIIGIEMSPLKDKENIHFFGQNLVENMFTRKMAEITVTKKKSVIDWGAILRQSNGGVLSGAVNPSDEPLETGSGFRINVQLKSGELFYTFMGCILTDYRTVPAAGKISEEVLVFKTNIWKVSSARNITAMAEADL